MYILGDMDNNFFPETKKSFLETFKFIVRCIICSLKRMEKTKENIV